MSKYYEDSDGKRYEEKEGICFISTACVEAVGLPDNASELMTLRQFRENHLVGTPTGNAILAEYREVSKEILSWISRQADKDRIFRDLFERLVLGSVALIRAGQMKLAVDHYRAIVSEYRLKTQTQSEHKA